MTAPPARWIGARPLGGYDYARSVSRVVRWWSTVNVRPSFIEGGEPPARGRSVTPSWRRGWQFVGVHKPPRFDGASIIPLEPAGVTGFLAGIRTPRSWCWQSRAPRAGITSSTCRLPLVLRCWPALSARRTACRHNVNRSGALCVEFAGCCKPTSRSRGPRSPLVSLGRALQLMASCAPLADTSCLPARSAADCHVLALIRLRRAQHTATRPDGRALRSSTTAPSVSSVIRANPTNGVRETFCPITSHLQRERPALWPWLLLLCLT